MRWEPNPEFIRQLEAEQVELEQTIEFLGKRLEERVKANALPHVRTGRFLRSIKGHIVRASEGGVFYRVYSDDPAAAEKEFGTEDTPAIRAFGKATGENIVY